jgi:hypothetical protein
VNEAHHVFNIDIKAKQELYLPTISSGSILQTKMYCCAAVKREEM